MSLEEEDLLEDTRLVGNVVVGVDDEPVPVHLHTSCKHSQPRD